MSSKSTSTPNRLVLVLVGVALVAFVGVVAVLSAGEGADLPSLDEVAGPVTLTGDPIPVPYPEDAATPDPAVGLPAPAITALDYADQEVALGGSERAQVLVFLAHWCPVCNEELPTLRSVIDNAGVPDGVDLVLVTTGLDPGKPNWPPQRWLEDAGLGAVTTVRDDAVGTLLRSFGLGAYPAWAVIGSDGTILARRQGELSALAVAQLLDAAAAS